MYTGKKVMAGKHVKADPGKKVMCRLPGLPMPTGAAEVHQHLQQQKEQRQRLPLLREKAPGVVRQADHHRADPITGVGPAAEAIADVN